MLNQTIRNRYAGLAALSQRTLPSKTAINKVFALLNRFSAPYEITEQGRKKIIKDSPLPEGWSDETTIPVSIAETRQFDVDDLMKQSTPVKKIPDTLRITSSDLPKVLEGKDGWKNVEGLAWIKHMLGGLYVPDTDELHPSVGEEEEPDEPAPAHPADDFAPAASPSAE